MATRSRKPLTDHDRAELPERLRQATELLERIARDRALLATLAADERRRLLEAAGEVFHPDPAARMAPKPPQASTTQASTPPQL